MTKELGDSEIGHWMTTEQRLNEKIDLVQVQETDDVSVSKTRLTVELRLRKKAFTSTKTTTHSQLNFGEIRPRQNCAE